MIDICVRLKPLAIFRQVFDMSQIMDAHPDIVRNLAFYPIENTNSKYLTRAQIEQYNALGYVFPLDVFSSAEAEANRVYFDDLMAKAEQKGHNSYSINGWQKYCAGIYDLVVEPRILDYVQDLLGENLICWGTHYFCKMPGDEKQVNWHQDASYWPLTPSKTVTVWLAIDDADVENGAMEVIPKSHLHGQIPFEKSTAEDKNVLNQSVRDLSTFDDVPVAFEMKAGQISLHTDLLLHGSKPNLSDRRRCGLTMRFVPPDVRALKDWNRNATICRGQDAEGHWIHHERPVGDTIPERK
jgi:non-haem Fe2+, alpha-ketoglutarate-dependent halogenase